MDVQQRNIALMGRSGAGKTTVARLLKDRYGYHICSPGEICRRVSDLLFGAQDRTQMNRVTDLMKEIDPLVWLHAAMRDVPTDKPLVYDSMRFAPDYDHLRHESFEVWRLETADEVRHERLRTRNQAYTLQDEEHALETELLGHPHHELINNDPDLAGGELLLRIVAIMERQSRHAHA